MWKIHLQQWKKLKMYLFSLNISALSYSVCLMWSPEMVVLCRAVITDVPSIIMRGLMNNVWTALTAWQEPASDTH